MEKRIIFSAVFASAALVACNNENLTEDSVKVPSVSEEIVGADFVSKGMTISIPSVSRAVNGGWEIGDKIGLGWYNVNFQSNPVEEGEYIWNEQSYENWGNIAGPYTKNESKKRDQKVYANHQFVINESGDFVTKGNIYQGGYFAYFPYQYESQIDQMTFDNINPEQTDEFNVERFNKSLHISAQDFISAEDVNDSGLELKKEFVLAPVVNALSVNVKPVEAESGAENVEETELSLDFFKGVNVKTVTITTDKDVFATSASLRPSRIPKVERDADGNIKVKETSEAIRKALLFAENSNPYSFFEKITYANTLTTNLSDKEIFETGKEPSVRMFTLPTKVLNPTAVKSISIAVGRKDYNLGTFTIRPNSKSNAATIDKINKALSDNGLEGGYSLTEILTDKDGLWTYLNLNIKLDLAEFKPILNVKSAEQWNDVVGMINALNSLNEESKDYTITLSNNIIFNEGEFTTPTVGKIIVKGNNKTITLNGNNEWPSNISGLDSYEPTVNVTGTLNVNNEVNNIKFESTVDGRINAGEKADITLTDNNASTVYVKYGAKVTNGISPSDIRYEINAGETISAKMIINLINESNASVNQFIVNSGVELNLLMKDQATPSDDAYEADGTPANLESKTLDDVDIIINGGKVYAETENTVGATVRNIYITGSNSVIENISLNGSDKEIIVNEGVIGARYVCENNLEIATLTLNEGAELTLDGNVDDSKTTFEINTITVKNGAKLTAGNKASVVYVSLTIEGQGSVVGDVTKN